MELTRREAIQLTAAAGAGVLMQSAALGEGPAEKPLRFVHLTDMHVPMDGKWEVGFGAALEAAGKTEAAFMITGGDHVYDALKAPLEKTLAQWKLYRGMLAAGTKMPVHAVLGNHDIWGWGLPLNELQKDANYGKQLGLDQLQMKRAYYSCDAGAWHFVILDSQMQRGPENRGYYAALDAEQMEWLKGDLKGVAKGRHICVVSHIPILAACVFFDGERLREDSWHVPDAWMHRDAAALQLLFMEHGVKLAISGHIHLYDVVKYNGVTYVCDGAVCGGWWKGSYHETPPGFGVFDLFADGRFEHKYVDFGWKAREMEK